VESLFNLASRMAHESVGYVLSGAASGILITALVGLLLRALTSIGARTRFAIWWITLIVVMAMPVLIAAGLPDVTPNDEPVLGEPVAGPAPPLSSTTRAEVLPAPPSERPPAPTGGLVALLPLAVGGAWTLGAIALITRLLLAAGGVHRISRRSQPAGEKADETLRRLARDLQLRRPTRLRLSPDIHLPMVTGGRRPTILLPFGLATQLTEEETEAILLHELSHVRRGDDGWKMLQKICSAVCFLHPAVHWIGRRLDLECEIACDDEVISRTGEPARYARCLHRLAVLATGPYPAPALGMAAPRKHIFRRFRAILGPRADHGTRGARLQLAVAGLTGAIGLVALLRVMPVIALPFDAVTLEDLRAPEEGMIFTGGPAESGRLVDWSLEHNNFRLSFTLHSEDGSRRLYTLWYLGEDDLRVATRGNLRFSLDGRAVTAISPDGFVSLIDRRHSPVREWELTPGPDGALACAYYEDGAPSEMGDEDRSRLGDALRVAVGGIDSGARERAAALLEREGASGLLEEIPRLRSDRVKRLTLSVFLAQQRIGRDDLRRTLRLVMEELKTTSLQTVHLLELARHVQVEEGLWDEYLDALARLDDDFERGRVLKAIATGRRATRRIRRLAIERAGDLLSPREIERFLGVLAPLCVEDPELWDACRRLADRIPDAYYRRNVRMALDYIEG